jgi:hypothetical protein
MYYRARELNHKKKELEASRQLDMKSLDVK